DLERIEEQKVKDIKNILKTFKKFKIPLTPLNTTVGPTAIKYEFLPENQKDIKTFVSLRFYIFTDLKQHYVTDPFPWMYVSKSKEYGEVITVETSNWVRKSTMLKDCLPELDKKKYDYPVILGKDFNNEILIKELKELDNILIVGWGMSGSSSFILSLLFTLLTKYSKEEFKLVIVSQMDLKHHNLSFLPHLFYDKVAIDSKEAIEALKKCVDELERREGSKVYGPPLLIVVEEFSGLFLNYKEFRKLVYILLERGNRVGIHLIFSTANRFANTITPKFKKHFSTRIVFATSNEQSIRVLEYEGGEYLDNRMDMLYKDMNSGKLTRLQGPHIFDDDISLLEKLAKNPPEKIDILKLRDEDYYTKELTPQRDPLIEEAQEIVRVNKKCTPSLLQRKLKIGYNRAARLVEELKKDDETKGEDPLYEDAKKIVVEERKASASFLQRRLNIGYNQASRLIQQLEENGIVSPQIGVKPREVLINEIKKEK
ncbi:DNA translocase FtsK, partial [Candidatus Dojkabacteria bacterium]|nr:DNA translocase FtsK [Candidatus Dojkabacteria bacterium]